MEKEELLNFLLNNISCFKNVTDMDFYLLATSQSNELGLMNDKVIKVTPLLKQISNYALVAAVIEKEEIEQIKKVLDDEQDLDIALEICEQCFKYINILRDENCLHPSVINSVNLINACQSYTIILETMSVLIKRLSGNFREDLINFCSLVDEKVIDEHDGLLELILDTVSDSQFVDSKQLLMYLCNYSIDCCKLTMLLTSNKMLLIDNWIVNISESKEINPENNFRIGDSINEFALVIQKADNYLNCCSDLGVIRSLERIKEAYELYNGYRYDYLKNEYRENYMLEKCKKM